ncbi:WYL domain-containing protein [Pseudobutyrivibrio xylanivorans]|uniref:WYL domain-containing protein n=1 Tax=Pseudobutyrivibrio xylanivorans TaxID=185007 RepID=UPI001FA952A4|nr:WYL domain-containing protein [Pseudobutyrivibrio xylanivorans]
MEPKKEGKKYRGSPWALTWADENYYLVAYDSEDGKVKHYRVDKMMKKTMIISR